MKARAMEELSRQPEKEREEMEVKELGYG